MKNYKYLKDIEEDYGNRNACFQERNGNLYPDNPCSKLISDISKSAIPEAFFTGRNNNNFVVPLEWTTGELKGGDKFVERIIFSY